MLDTEENLAKLKDKNNIITIKEGVTYRLKVKFKVQHDVISGLKYLHSVKKLGIRVDKMEEMVGSYGPNAGSFSTDIRAIHEEVSHRGITKRYACPRNFPG